MGRTSLLALHCLPVTGPDRGLEEPGSLLNYETPCVSVAAVRVAVKGAGGETRALGRGGAGVMMVWSAAVAVEHVKGDPLAEMMSSEVQGEVAGPSL